VGVSSSKNDVRRKQTILEEVSGVDLEWKKLVAEEKEVNENLNDLERFSTAMEFGERNRYNEVLALEETRVKLVDSESDYINANWVDGINDDSEKNILQLKLLYHILWLIFGV